jgi:hypothetical protein
VVTQYTFILIPLGKERRTIHKRWPQRYKDTGTIKGWENHLKEDYQKEIEKLLIGRTAQRILNVISLISIE